jgi:predicted aspartyl protease
MLEWRRLMSTYSPLLPALRAVAFWALALPCTTGFAAQCTLEQLADVAVTMNGYQPLVAASINGKAATMMLDTGATKSMIWRSSAKAMNLRITGSDARMYGVDGRAAAGVVTIRDFGLLGAMAHNISMITAGSGDAPGGSVGLLGEDVISDWDLDIDFSAGRMRRFRPKDCKGEQVIAIWGATNYSMLPLVTPPPESGYLWAHVQINDRQVLAMFDSGASLSVVTTLALQRLGLKAETQIESAGVSGGVANKALKTSTATFASMKIGQESIQNVRLHIADLFSRDTEVGTGSLIPQSVLDPPDLLIGADFFLAHHVYIARSQGRIYFSYKGGPIFQRDVKPPHSEDPGAPAPPATSQDPAPSSAQQ